MIAKKDLPTCPVATTVGLIGNKWKLLILRDILSGTKRFNELQKSLGVSQKVLSENLKSMERDGILDRAVYPEVPPRVEYSISELGITLQPVIAVMERWGTEYQRTIDKK